MIAELGSFALMLALAMALAQLGLSAAARIKRSPALAGAGEGAAAASFLATAVGFAALIWAFVTSDFSVANVAANSHTDKPLLYKVAGAWGSHEGSMLLWCLYLTGFSAAVALFGRSTPLRLKTLVLATQGAISMLFLAYMVAASSPFQRLVDPPVEGRSLNPLLQDPALAFHPPFLYSGYVGCSVVFAFAIAALIEGRIDTAWARWVRPWTLAAWSLLTVGITLGAFWSYYELGWGGWWAWDPVENVSFMPWLAATALLHSAIVTEKRGALGGWTVFLGIAAFSFSMLGAFVVRSGVLTSVHAFAVDPERGALLLVILAVTAGAAFALFAWRAPAIAQGGLFAPISRESALVLNNILLAAATTTVLLGTLFPLIREAATGQPISVGPPYFNLTFAPLMAIALLVLPAGPLLAWKRADALGAMQRLWAAAALAVVAGVAVMAAFAFQKVAGAIGLALGLWLIVGALAELAERARVFRVPLREALRRIGGLPHGAWGMTLAHIGLGIFVLGACVESGWKVETAQVLQPGQELRLGERRLTLDRVEDVEGPNYIAERGSVTARNAKGQTICKVSAERRFYPDSNQATSEIGLCLKGANHLYVVLGEAREGGWLLRAYWNPWASLIFLGPFVMALGGAVSLSDRRLRLAAPRRAAEAT